MRLTWLWVLRPCALEERRGCWPLENGRGENAVGAHPLGCGVPCVSSGVLAV